MPVKTEATSSSVHHERLLVCAVDLAAALRQVVQHFSASRIGPSELSRLLGIDKTLASRVLRTVRAPDPAVALSNSPAPTGLRLFISAARARRLPASLEAGAVQAVDAFEQMLDSMPDGRTGLHALLADLVGGELSNQERSAKQTVYKGMSYLLGCHAKTLFSTIILSPSAIEDRIDETCVMGRLGLRRLRQGTASIVMSNRFIPTPNHPEGKPLLQTLGLDEPARPIEGDRSSQNADEFLIRAYCTPGNLKLRAVRESNTMYYMLDPDTAQITEASNVVMGFRNTACHQRYRTAGQEYELSLHTNRLAARASVLDVIVHDSLLTSGEPTATIQLPGSAVPGRTIDHELSVAERVALGSTLVRQPEISRRPLRMDGLRTYNALVTSVIQAIPNPDANSVERYRVYRCTLIYPVPFLATHVWLPLPEKPGT